MSTIAKSLRDALSRALLPPTCCLCGADGVAPDLDLCEGCVTLLPLNAPDGGAFPSCASNLVRVVVPFHYAFPVDHFIRRLKFRGERVLARVLGSLLGDAVRALRQPMPECLVPVPLHRERYRQRGFNQAHEIARYAAERLNVPVDARCLMRKVATREQSGLSLIERRANVRGAFEVVRPLAATRVALIDDVLTTGSTALAAASALTAAGVSEVQLWAVARVMLD
jgi:ComF family protein